MVILIKPGVFIREINDQFLELCNCLWECREPNAYPTITSGDDDRHMEGSLHGKGLAWDIRTRDLSSPTAMAMALRDKLSDDWDVVFEENHIHVEWDPNKKEVA